MELFVLDQDDVPVPARIRVTGGIPPVVRFLGASTFFTGLGAETGKSSFMLAPGEYVLEVSSGGGFTSAVEKVGIVCEPGGTLREVVHVTTLHQPADRGWYSADLHHHADKLDGITPPSYLVRSQLAARLDLLLVSDHDDVDNHTLIADAAAAEGVPFIPAVEVSPNWAHFVMLNLPLGQYGIDPGGTPTQIFEQARSQGATIVVAHPYITYDYFYNKDKQVIPGEYDCRFDLIELQSTKVTSRGNSADERTLKRTMELWTHAASGASRKYYLTGGTDVHDVWSHQSGAIRTYVHLGDDATTSNFIHQLKKGHAFVTMGPLVYPVNVMYGESYPVPQGTDFSLRLEVFAVNGLRSVEVYSNHRDAAGNFVPVEAREVKNSFFPFNNYPE